MAVYYLVIKTLISLGISLTALTKFILGKSKWSAA